jgi:hypothetical protein
MYLFIRLFKCLTILSVARTVQLQMEGYLVSKVLERICKKMVVANYNVVYQTLPWMADEQSKPDIWFSLRDWSPEPPD